MTKELLLVQSEGDISNFQSPHANEKWSKHHQNSKKDHITITGCVCLRYEILMNVFLDTQSFKNFHELLHVDYSLGFSKYRVIKGGRKRFVYVYEKVNYKTVTIPLPVAPI